LSSKEPVLLTVLIETAKLRWYVAGIDLDGAAIPLMCSEEGNLSAYLGDPFDEQVTFLRHRLSGVLQRGCDRLWGRQKKPCQIVFLTDGPFVEAAPELTNRVAEHFVEWMTSPPVVFLTSDRRFTPDETGTFRTLAGGLEPSRQTALLAGLPGLFTAMADAKAWELAPPKSKK
jgi:hypothetical protein